METATKKNVVIRFLVSWVILAGTEGSLQEADMAHQRWDGVAIFQALDRQVLQGVLDEYHQQSLGGRNAPQLYFPDNPVFRSELRGNQHVAYIDFGNEVFLDFEGVPGAAFSSVAITIPLLTDGRSEAPAYSLARAKLIQRSQVENQPIPNMAIPHIPIDEVKVHEGGAHMRNGEEEMIVRFERHTHPCEPPSDKEFHEFDDYMQYDVQMGALRPNFDGCDAEDPPSSADRFCSIVDGMRDDIDRVVPNFCQSAWKSEDKYTCNATVVIEKITPWFRDFVFFGADQIDIISTEAIGGHFTIGLKYPCVE